VWRAEGADILAKINRAREAFTKAETAKMIGAVFESQDTSNYERCALRLIVIVVTGLQCKILR
jgi:hypothetical protein